MTIEDYINGFGKLDFEFVNGLLDTGVYPPIPHNEYKRFVIHTDRIHKFLLEKTGKDIPIDKRIAISNEEYFELRELIEHARVFSGMIGEDYPKGYDWWKYYYEGVRYPITDELETFDFKYVEL